jgi:hypothetical protein
MIDVAISYKQSDTPKGILKHASKKARRRESRKEIKAQLAERA